MSSIGFLTADHEARVSGREHGKLRGVREDVAWTAFTAAFSDGTGGLDEQLVHSAIDLPGWVTDGGRGFADCVSLFLRTSHDELVVRTPTSAGVANVLETSLNTVVAQQPPAVALASRIVAQCEVNAWIAGEHRGWLADLIERGMGTPLDGGTLFSDSPHWKSHYDGWAAVCAMLRAGDGMVVLDYSVTDGFPDAKWAAFPGDAGKRFRRWWTAATPDQRWAASARGLVEYTRTGPWMLQISPDNLHETSFGYSEAWTWGDLAGAWRATLTPNQTNLT